MRLIIFVFFFNIYIIPNISTAQELLPFIENFTKTDYNGDNQVWNVAQGGDNALYFANNHFLLRYDGIKWEKYLLPNKTIIRSVFSDGDRIYCGSYKEFGYWKRIAGKMVYTSLSAEKLFLGNSDNEEVWKIFRHGNKLYFQSFNELYIYDGRRTEKLKFPSQISYCYVTGNKIYAATVRNGIYIFKENKFVPIASWLQARENIIHGIEQNNGQFYVFTKNNGIYTGSANRLSVWNHPINIALKEDIILAAKFIDKNTLAIGTALRGIYIVNLASGNYKNINRTNGLRNNAVLSIITDREGDLWLGLDNGIAHIEINSPVSILTDTSGILGSVYSLYALDEGFLLATNHGLFHQIGNVSLPLPDSQGQVWDIFNYNDKYIIGHNDGTLLYNDSRLTKVNSVSGGWKFLKSDYDNAYFQANYSGIAVYRNINNLSEFKTLDSITKPIRNIAQNKPGELWAADNYRSLYRILYDKNFNVTKVQNITAANNIFSDFGVKLFNYRNEILSFIDNAWYKYNNISGRLEKDNIFNKLFSNISDIAPIDDDSFIIIRDGQLYIVTQHKSNFVSWLIPEKYYQGRLIMENTRISNDKKGLLVNLDDGFILIKPTRQNNKDAKVILEAFSAGRMLTPDSEIAYNQSVEVNILSGYYGYNKPDFLYKLDGIETYFTAKKGQITLNNLSSGKHKVRVYYNNGQEYVQAASLYFYVARPWYFSISMIMVYIIAVSGLFFLYYRWNKFKYIQKIKLNEEELRHRRQILELEMEAEKKLRQQEYEKHMLENEVQTKASEVAGKSLSIAKHSEMIENIQQVLDEVAGENDLKQRIKKIIKSSTLSKNEWQSFEKNLVKSHEDFVARLSANYPSLTPKDIKLSIYLKMNLSSKEIAPLMNISYRGVELHRYRLRKKLALSQDESLLKFMINL